MTNRSVRDYPANELCKPCTRNDVGTTEFRPGLRAYDIVNERLLICNELDTQSDRRQVNNWLTGWAFVHLVNNFAHPVN